MSPLAPHKEIEVFYEGSSGWQRARPIPNLRVAMVMTGAGEKGGDVTFFLSVLYLCILPTFHPFFLSFLSFFLSPVSVLSHPWPLLEICLSHDLLSLSISLPPTPPFNSFPTINLWLSKPVISSGGLAPGWKRGMRDLRSFATEVWE